MARLSAEIGNPRGYINQAARAGSRLVQARLGTYRASDRLWPGQGLAKLVGTSTT